MSDTPKLADECKRLLDNGWYITLYRNALGSYTARATTIDRITKHKQSIGTDDFEPSQSLYRLTEKVFGTIV